MRYPSTRLSYYYFRFLKADIRNIGMLRPVLIFVLLVVIGMSLCIGVPNFIHIGQRTAEL